MMDQTVPIPFDDDDSPPPEHREGWLLVRIQVPELNVSKCLQFPTDRLVWDVKQQVLASLPKDLKESFNYGLFCPPSNGKAGKFLDEERRLGDYPFSGPVGYLEFKYKRRVYKMLNLDEKQLKALHTRANLRRFLEYLNNGQVEKVSKMCTKGLDPNFHCPETNETPLTIAVGLKKPNKLLIALVNGGAILDYRAKDGSTALHRAVEKNCLESVSTLLELGASPNYRDVRGITPVYLSVTKKADPKISECLLHDHATLGIQDSQGWQEIHQACRNGLVHHLEHLLFYGADMNGRNASGNTPLHVCAVNNQEACARMLLFRGAQRGSLNYANQTPYQVAVIAGNLELAEMIQNYKPEDIVPFRGPPRYNPRRRSGLGWPSVGSNNHCIGSGGMGTVITSSATMFDLRTLNRLGIGGPPSPCLSEQPFSSASSSLSEGSSHRSHEDDISIVTDKSLGDTSDIISDSSGVGTASSSDSTACSIGNPNMTVVCMIPYAKNFPGHLTIQPGQVIEVFGSTDCGLLEGQVRGTNRQGLFPVQYVQEVNFRQKNITNVSTAPSQQPLLYMDEIMRVGDGALVVGQSGHRMAEEHQQNDYNMLNNNNSVNNNNLINMNSPFHNINHNGTGGGQYSSLTAPRIKKVNANEPRSVTLHRAKRGFGFVLRGAKATSPLMQLKPSDRCPALQYLDDVDPGGVADLAGLKRGDYLLAINNNDVRAASHEQVVDLIRKSGALVSLTVLSAPNNGPDDANGNLVYAAAAVALSNGNGFAAANRQCSTLPRRIMQQNGGKMPAPAPPQRDPKTTLSVGRARAKSMVAGLECDDTNDNDVSTATITTNKSSSAESIHNQSQSNTPTQGGTPVAVRTASIKARPTSSRITAAELEELFQRQQGAANADRYSSMMTTSNFRTGGDSGSVTPHMSPQKAPLVYSSVADMKRKKAKGGNAVYGGGTLRGKPCDIPTLNGEQVMRRTFHSTPDLTVALAGGVSEGGPNGWAAAFINPHTSQDEMNRYRGSMQRLNLPPPSHPPPPAPIQLGHVVKVDVSSEYESTANLRKAQKSAVSAEVMSSFKPSFNAKLYASPEDIRTVAFRAKMDKSRRKTTQVTSLSGPGGLCGDYAQPLTVVGHIEGNTERSTMPSMSQSAYNMSAAANDPSPSPSPHPPPPPPPEQPAPPIPDPDYSVSESEDVDEDYESNSRLAKKEVANAIPPPPAPAPPAPAPTQIPVPTKVAMNPEVQKPVDVQQPTSSVSSGSGGSANNAMLHSFSVFELQKMRNNLKPSKSYPDYLKEKVVEEKGEEEELPREDSKKMDDTPAEIKPMGAAISPASVASVPAQNLIAEKMVKSTIVTRTEMTSSGVPEYKKPEAQVTIPIVKKSVNFAMESKPGIVTKALSHYATPRDEIKLPIKSTEKPLLSHPSSIVKHDYKEPRTVGSLMAANDDDDDEIGLDELDDEYLLNADSPSPPPMEFQRHNSMTRKQATNLAMQRAIQIQRPAGNLNQLPPPLENCIVESDLEVLANSGIPRPLVANNGKQHYHVHSHIAHSHNVHGHAPGHYTNRQHNNPIQIQFHATTGVLGAGDIVQGIPTTSPSTENLVLAPPPQFSDGVSDPNAMGQSNKHTHGTVGYSAHHGHGMANTNRGQVQQLQQKKLVRIVGAVPKSTNRF